MRRRRRLPLFKAFIRQFGPRPASVIAGAIRTGEAYVRKTAARQGIVLPPEPKRPRRPSRNAERLAALEERVRSLEAQLGAVEEALAVASGAG